METRGFRSNIQCYFYVLPLMHAVLGGVGVQISLCVGFGERKLSKFEWLRNYSLPSFIAAWAAERRAIGTRKGEQDT